MYQGEQPNDAKKRKRLEKHENVTEKITRGNIFCSYFYFPPFHYEAGKPRYPRLGAILSFSFVTLRRIRSSPTLLATVILSFSVIPFPPNLQNKRRRCGCRDGVQHPNSIHIFRKNIVKNTIYFIPLHGILLVSFIALLWNRHK